MSEKSVKEIVYQAIVDLTNTYGLANREMVVQATGFKAPLVDEAVKQLREVDLAINRHKNGQWTPVFKFDAPVNTAQAATETVAKQAAPTPPKSARKRRN